MKNVTDPAGGSAVQVGQPVTYQFSIHNLSAAPLTNIVATDQGITNLTLTNPGVSGCPANYNGVITPGGGTVNFLNITGNIASWATIASLPVGASATFTMCGIVGGSFGQNSVNGATINYDNCLTGTTPCLTSTALVPISNIISGYVYNDRDVSGNFTAGEVGIGGVLIDLYEDNNNNGILDGGDTVASSTVTGSTGYYEFTAIPNGNYIIVESNLVGYTSRGDFDNAPLACTPSATNNGCDTIGGGTPGSPAAITVTNSTNLPNRNFFDSFDAPELQMTKSALPDPVIKGGALAYTLSILNNGTIPATGVVVRDTLPTGVTWVSTANSNIGTLCSTDAVLDCDCTQPDGTQAGGLVCQLGSVAVGATETITINVTVD